MFKARVFEYNTLIAFWDGFMVEIVARKGAVGVGGGKLGGRGQSFARYFGESLFAVGAFGFNFCPFGNTGVAETVRMQWGRRRCV